MSLSPSEPRRSLRGRRHSARRSVSKRTQRAVSIVLTAILVAVYIVVVANNDGIDRTELSLDDNGVWVINNREHLVGHLNYPARSIDASAGTNADSDVMQEKDTVFSENLTDNTLASLVASDVTIGTPHALSGANQTGIGNGTLGILNSATGEAWITPTETFDTFATSVDEPIWTDLTDGALAVGQNGAVHVVSAQEGVWRSSVPEGSTRTITEHKLPADVAGGDSVQITAVGKDSVVLDATTGVVVLPSGSMVDLGDSEQLQLQQAGPEADEVLIASATTLYEVNLTSGEITRVASDADNPEASGVAAQPVRHEGCAYAAWSGSGRVVRDCAGTENDDAVGDPDLAQAQQPVFRVNRRIIVLNDISDGKVWLPDEDMFMISDWDEDLSEEKVETESQENSADLTEQRADPDREEENQPPVAQDDEFGVRPGRTTTLPVTMNDSDKDGDILTVAPVTEPGFGTLNQIRNGEALQIDTPEDAAGSTAFDYEAGDGRGGSDTATVTVNVHPFSENEAPTQWMLSEAEMSAGGTLTLQVLGDWIDPDGDAIYLAGAIAPEDFDVSYQENGSLTISHLGGTPGEQEIKLLVSDGQDTGEGTFTVRVTEGGNKPPRANADHARVAVGETVTVAPLENDVDANGDQLSLVGIGTAPSGLIAQISAALGTVTVSADKPGTYYLSYSVSDGPSTSVGVIRVDAFEADNETPPVLEDDIALLPSGGQTVVDVLSNDTDPAGGVLTVQSVQAEDGSPLVVSPVNHETVRITAPSGLTEPVEFTYTASNGVSSSTARVTAIPTPAADDSQPPEAGDDTLVVRSGDVGSVAVLDNDRSPAGLTLTVLPDVQSNADPAMGEVFLSDNVIRFRAGEKTGSTQAVYTVRDSLGNVASARVNITVTAVDEQKNTAPTPQNITARAIAGQTVTIPVQLDGIDAEGDSVELVGVGESPHLGTASAGTVSITYKADSRSSGTDTFTYIVQDAFGKTATARIRVGIAPPTTVNQAPVAARDEVNVRPGVRIAAPVTENDTDPDGDPITLVQDSAQTSETSMDLSQRGNSVVIETPAQEGSYQVSYQITDGRGGFANGLLTVNVSQTAPERAPVARDDAVDRQDAYGKKTVRVNVLANDEDPDGDILDSTVTSSDPGVKVNRDGSLTIDTAETRRVILYTVTDGSDLSASAIVRVPANTLNGPTVDSTKVPILVESGKKTTIELNDYIMSRPGHSVMIADPSKVAASVGWDGSSLVVDDDTLAFTAREDFSGSTSITLPVTDGDSRDDPGGRTATVTLPIEVSPEGNRAPIFTPTSVEVEAGGDTATVNLNAMTVDDDGDPLEYSVGTTPDGITADLNGSVLRIKAAASAQVGTAGTVRLTISDGKDDVQGALPVVIVRTDKPLIQIGEHVATVSAGSTTRFDVTEFAVNPFPNEPLTLSGTPTVTSGNATVSAAGTVVAVTTPDNVHGQVIVEYHLQDATRDPSRTVRGILRLNVQDRPDPVTGISAQATDAHTAIIRWTNGSPNGSDFTRFVVRDLTSGKEQSCPVGSQCIMGDLELGDHTFEVIAYNAVGGSDPARSGTITLDVVPKAPQNVTGEATDGHVTFRWDAAETEGSPVQSYTVNYCTGHTTVSATTVTVDVPNGTACTATVVANNAQGSSAASAPSQSVTPYGPPGPVKDLKAENTTFGETSGSGGTVVISWNPPDSNNGRAIENYVVQYPGGTQTTTATSVTVDLPYGDHSVAVYAVNDAARGSNSETKNATVAVRGVPGKPTGGSVRATGQAGQLAVTSPSGGGAVNGWKDSEIAYEMSVNSGPWQAVSGTIDGLEDGKESSVKFRATATFNSQKYSSAESDTVSATPYGTPEAPKLECRNVSSNSRTVTCSWSGGNFHGTAGGFELSGSASGNVDASGSTTFDPGWSADWNVCITAYRSTPSGGNASAQNCANGRTGDKIERYTFSIGDDNKIQVRFDGYDTPQTGTGEVSCTGPSGARSVIFTVDSNGNVSQRDLEQEGGGIARAGDVNSAYDNWKCTGNAAPH